MTKKRFVNPIIQKPLSLKYAISIFLILLAWLFIGGMAMIALIASKYGINFLESENFLNGKSIGNFDFFSQMVTFVIGFLMILVCVKWVLKIPIIYLFTARKRFDWKRFVFAGGFWFILAALSCLPLFWNENKYITWNYNASSFWVLFILVLLLAPIQTLFEELLCRSLLLQFCGTFIRKGMLNVIVSTSVFGLLHMGNPEVFAYGFTAVFYFFFTGFALAFITLMDDGIELTWGFHFVNNAFLFLFISSDHGSMQTAALWRDSTPPGSNLEIWLSSLLLVIYVYFLAKKYKWSDWKERLWLSKN